MLHRKEGALCAFPICLEKQAVVYIVTTIIEKQKEDTSYAQQPTQSQSEEKAPLKCHLLSHLASSDGCNVLNSQSHISQLPSCPAAHYPVTQPDFMYAVCSPDLITLYICLLFPHF